MPVLDIYFCLITELQVEEITSSLVVVYACIALYNIAYMYVWVSRHVTHEECVCARDF